MEATMEQETQAPVDRPKTALYLSRRAELHLVRVPIRPIYGAGGQKVDETRGERIEFRDGRFDCPLEGTYEFPNGEEVEAEELRAWLDKHKLNGDVAEGFWRVDPQAPAPSGEELQAIMELAMNLDIDSLRRTLRTEAEGWQREPVLALTRRAIEKVESTLAQIDAAKTPDAPAEPAAAPAAEDEKPKRRGRGASPEAE